MKKALKWTGVVLGGWLGLIVLAVVGLSASANARLNKRSPNFKDGFLG
jgi:hypothetical protein